MKIEFLERAYELAKKGCGFTSPNPCVGVVVVKGGKIVSEGFHLRAGDHHAEVLAIKKFLNKFKHVSSDVELYVTLEPCSHFGKTPPCVDLILSCGFKKVFVGMRDPFTMVNGKGIKRLKSAGVEVQVLNVKSELAGKIRLLNQPFLKSVRHGLPYVILKAGLSLDGKIATSSGESKWITSEKARVDARLERSKCDCVLIGVGTVLSDDPELVLHKKYKNKTFWRVVVDPFLDSPISSKIFKNKNVIIICKSDASSKRILAFEKLNVLVKRFSGDKISNLECFKFLYSLGILSVFVEGGSGVFGYLFDDFLKNKLLVDKVMFYIAPKLLGGVDSLSVIGGVGAKSLSNLQNLKNLNVYKFGDDIKVEGFYNLF